MKLMIASDIHGSAFYCEKLLECYKNEKADKLNVSYAQRNMELKNANE